jgi:hypothetical protein
MTSVYSRHGCSKNSHSLGETRHKPCEPQPALSPRCTCREATVLIIAFPARRSFEEVKRQETAASSYRIGLGWICGSKEVYAARCCAA